MNKEHSEYLIKNFPNLYQGYGGDPRETLMAFGFECGDGWFEIIKELSEKLEPLDVVAVQVKEKFGTLRFYIGYGCDEAFDAIDLAGDKSAETCEKCGEPGSLRDAGWVHTLCNSCDVHD